MPIPKPVPATWAGWYKPSLDLPWIKVVEADSERECWHVLKTRCTGGETDVLPAGEHPATKRK